MILGSTARFAGELSQMPFRRQVAWVERDQQRLDSITVSTQIPSGPRTAGHRHAAINTARSTVLPIVDAISPLHSKPPNGSVNLARSGVKAGRWGSSLRMPVPDT